MLLALKAIHRERDWAQAGCLDPSWDGGRGGCTAVSKRAYGPRARGLRNAVLPPPPETRAAGLIPRAPPSSPTPQPAACGRCRTLAVGLCRVLLGKGGGKRVPAAGPVCSCCHCFVGVVWCVGGCQQGLLRGACTARQSHARRGAAGTGRDGGSFGGALDNLAMQAADRLSFCT